MTVHLPRRREKRCVFVQMRIKPSLKDWIDRSAAAADITVARWLEDELMRTRGRLMRRDNLRRYRREERYA